MARKDVSPLRLGYISTLSYCETRIHGCRAYFANTNAFPIQGPAKTAESKQSAAKPLRLLRQPVRDNRTPRSISGLFAGSLPVVASLPQFTHGTPLPVNRLPAELVSGPDLA